MAKEVTREQAATKNAQAAGLMERTGQHDRAQEYRSMSVEDYAREGASHNNSLTVPPTELWMGRNAS